MELNDFKYIFWWEWFHRFFARFLGLVFIIPLMIFIFQKKISKKLFFNLLILFCFGLFQAIVGWWMVKSGLNENPYVSQYRLSFHLLNQKLWRFQGQQQSLVILLSYIRLLS